MSTHSLPEPTNTEGESSIPATTTTQSLELVDAIAKIAATRPIFSEDSLPPTLPTPYKRWNAQRAPDAPHDPNAYFPMHLYK